MKCIDNDKVDRLIKQDKLFVYTGVGIKCVLFGKANSASYVMTDFENKEARCSSEFISNPNLIYFYKLVANVFFTIWPHKSIDCVEY